MHSPKWWRQWRCKHQWVELWRGNALEACYECSKCGYIEYFEPVEEVR